MKTTESTTPPSTRAIPTAAAPGKTPAVPAAGGTNVVQGAAKIGTAVVNGAETVGEALLHGTQTAGKMLIDGSETMGESIVQGSANVVRVGTDDLGRAGEATSDLVWNAADDLGDSARRLGRAAKRAASRRRGPVTKVSSTP
jgi:hypothetical protein